MLGSIFGATASPAAVSEWSITRSDYVEFCADTSYTADLIRGELTIAKGKCDPDRNAYPQMIVKPLPRELTAEMAQLAMLPRKAAFIRLDCKRDYEISIGRPPQTLPGPSFWVISRS